VIVKGQRISNTFPVRTEIADVGLCKHLYFSSFFYREIEMQFFFYERLIIAHVSGMEMAAAPFSHSSIFNLRIQINSLKAQNEPETEKKKNKKKKKKKEKCSSQ